MSEEEIEPPTGGFCAEQMEILRSLKNAVVDIFSSKSDKDNTIFALYDVGEVVATAGPGLLWKIHDAVQKKSEKKCSVFLFDQRDVDQSNKKEKTKLIAAMKDAIVRLQSNTLLNSIEVWHRLEEGPNLLAFVTEPIVASFANIFGFHKAEEMESLTMTSWPLKLVQPYNSSLHPNATTPGLPLYAKEHYFFDIECRYGAIQIIEALSYLHHKVKIVHGNVCPANVVVAADGSWKLVGFEFSQRGEDPKDWSLQSQCAKWDQKLNETSQPALNYTAPEIQTDGHKNILSDMYSFGLVLLALYNCGKPIIDAQGSHEKYLEEITHVNVRAAEVMQRMPVSLQEVVERMLVRELMQRPPLRILKYIRYFSGCLSDGAIRILQFLKDYPNVNTETKAKFLKNIKNEHLDLIPKKMLIDRVFDTLKPDLTNQSLLAALTPVIVQIIRNESEETFSTIIYPVIRKIYTTKQNITAENAASNIAYIQGMNILLEKCSKKRVIRQELFNFLLYALENPILSQAAITTVGKSAAWIGNENLFRKCLPRVYNIIQKTKNQEIDICLSTLNLFEHIIGRVDRVHLYEFIIPSIQALSLVEATVMSSVVKLLGLMINDQRLGLSHTQLADKILACVAANAENNTDNQLLTVTVTEILQSMMEMLEREQNQLIEEKKSLMVQRQQSLKHKNIIFFVPELRVKRKLSSEEVARQNFAIAAEQANAHSNNSVTGNIRTFITMQRTEISQWFFGLNNSTNSNNINDAGPSGINYSASSSGSRISDNLLHIESLLPSRRSSDNSLMAPKIKIAPSCASTPGATPAHSTAGLPAPRRSCIDPQERRSSHALLLPPPAIHGSYRNDGSGSSLTVPTSQPACGSPPVSETQSYTSRKNSNASASVKSAERAQATMLGARESVSARSSPAQDNRRPSACATKASSAAAVAPTPRASTSEASTSRSFTHAAAASASAAATQPRGHKYGVRRLPFVGSRAPPVRSSPRRRLPNIHHHTSITTQAEIVANNMANNINDMAEAVSNAMPNSARVTRLSARSIRLIRNPMH